MPATASRPTRTGRKPALALLAAALIGALVGWWAGPDPRLGGSVDGDPGLAADVRDLAGEGRGLTALSVARLTDGAVAFAGSGDAGAGRTPTPDTPFELGSVTKVFTGMLLADGVERGEVALDDTLATHLPELANTAVGGVRLADLATHTSGVPRLPAGMVELRSAYAPVDPYAAWDADRLVDAARTSTLNAPGEEEYSNFGVALLGAAQARAAGAATWADLVDQRVFTPLGMTSTHIAEVAGADAGGDALATPHWVNGRVAEPWTGGGFAPAGSSTRTTARDLATFAAAVLDETAPGMAALEPVAGDFGLGWVVNDREGEPTLVGHSGGTGGTRTTLMLSPDAGRAVVVLATTDASVDTLGAALLEGGERFRAPIGLFGIVGLGVAALVLLSGVVGLRRTSTPSRLGALSGVLDASVGLALLVLLGPWHWAPAWALGALGGGLVGVAGIGLARAGAAPWWPQGRATGAVVSAVVSVAIAFGSWYLLT